MYNINKKAGKTYNFPESCVELIREKSQPSNVTINNAIDVFNLLVDLRYKDREHLMMLCLNSENVLTCKTTICIGSKNLAYVQPSEIFKAAILSNAVGIILVHNHPTNNPEPSVADLIITKRIQECGKLLKIPLLDHVIVSSSDYYSVMENKEAEYGFDKTIKIEE